MSELEKLVRAQDESLADEYERYAKATGISVEGAIMSALYAFMGEAR